MNKTYTLKGLILTLCLFVLTASTPITVEAAYSSRASNAYRSKINKLDDDVVKNIPVPILFGVSLIMITPNFGDPRGGGTRTHEGLDIMAPKGAPIVSPTEAVVIMTGTGPDSGKYITTANPGGETFVYMHLSEILVKKGAVLKVGDLLGFVGNTGNASAGAPHLHFEIRENRKAQDPFLRITKEFTLGEKIKFLGEMLDQVGDEDEFIEFLVDEYPGVFYQARMQKIALPKNLEKKLPTNSNVSITSTRNLQIGSDGEDVMVLQSILITEGYLRVDAPTGYFGALTESALIAYQKAHKIAPANGTFGEATRAYLRGTEAPTEKQLQAQIAELQVLLAKIQAELALQKSN